MFTKTPFQAPTRRAVLSFDLLSFQARAVGPSAAEQRSAAKMPCYWAGNSTPSPIFRTNRSGNGVGSSPGINPITPYTTASLDYRASWISGQTVADTKAAMTNPNIQGKLFGEAINNESKAFANSMARPAKPTVLPPPVKVQHYNETSGLERSLPTNVPDHPTAIQVNGLRQERTEHVMCPGHVFGVNSYDARVLCGNWAEERSDKSYNPSDLKASTGNDWWMETTYGEMTKNRSHLVRPPKGSNSDTMYTQKGSAFATGVKEESKSSNAEPCVPEVDDYLKGDHRSASRRPGNYVSYQAGRQHLIAAVGGKINELPFYESTTMAGYQDPAEKVLPNCTVRCDLKYKPPFQIRDPGRDGKSKMLCTVKSNEFACDDPVYNSTQIIGRPVKGKQNTYTVESYRNTWTKSPPEIVAAGLCDTSTYKACFTVPDLSKVDATRKMAGHVGSWH
jgi:hypothetical protein